MEPRLIATPPGRGPRQDPAPGRRYPGPPLPLPTFPNHADDRHLLFHAGDGNTVAFTRLYQKYLPMVTDFLISRSTPDVPHADLAQEVFLRAWKGAHHFRGESTIKTYLFAIAIRVLHENRSKSPRTAIPKSQTIDVGHACPCGCSSCHAATHSEAEACRRELEQQLADRLAHLPAAMRKAIELTLYKRLDPPRAARAAGCSIRTFRKRFRRAIARLRTGLRDHES
jgi:RNA polymerase sigma-70 factor (ECF subfamily)